jgi:hypothetical protein
MQTIWRYVFMSLLITVAPDINADGNVAGDNFVFYPRLVIRNNSANLLSFNGLYRQYTSWAAIEYGARIVESDGGLSQWSYKLELTSQPVLDKYRASLRLLKNDIYASAITQETVMIERLTGSHDLSEDFEVLKGFSIDGELGLAQKISNAATRKIIPDFSGSLNVIPLFMLKANYRLETSGQTYSFILGDFDVFDAYPASQPFLQVELAQKQNDWRYFGYIRYRWENSISQFYSLYLAVGVEIPN